MEGTQATGGDFAGESLLLEVGEREEWIREEGRPLRQDGRLTRTVKLRGGCVVVVHVLSRWPPAKLSFTLKQSTDPAARLVRLPFKGGELAAGERGVMGRMASWTHLINRKATS